MKGISEKPEKIIGDLLFVDGKLIGRVLSIDENNVCIGYRKLKWYEWLWYHTGYKLWRLLKVKLVAW